MLVTRQDASVTQEELDELIAANVRAARARLNLRQDDVADELGWDRAIVSRIELGRRRLQLVEMIALCDVLKIDLRQLLAGVDAKTLKTLGLDRRGDQN
jgi:transcriptional regulator with XRE-family HTH domain